MVDGTLSLCKWWLRMALCQDGGIRWPIYGLQQPIRWFEGDHSKIWFIKLNISKSAFDLHLPLILLRECLPVFVDHSTCCQFVFVVWRRDSLRPNATSMLELVVEDEEENRADLAVLAAIFSIIQQPSSQTSADRRWNCGELGRKPWTQDSSLEPHKLILWGGYEEMEGHRGSLWT